MKISDLYKIKGVPVITALLTAISFIMSCIVCYFMPEQFDNICLSTRPAYVWQYVSGIFIHNIEPQWVMWVHMIMNFMGLIPLGIIVEKIIGSKTTFGLVVVEASVTAICFQVVTWNQPGQACGISSVGYAFATVGFYCTFLVLRRRGVPCYKQPLFYYFLFEFLGMLGMLNPLNSMVSFVLHFSGVIVGCVWIFMNREKIDIAITNKENELL